MKAAGAANQAPLTHAAAAMIIAEMPGAHATLKDYLDCRFKTRHIRDAEPISRNDLIAWITWLN
jgi:hypothetical protein